MKVAIVCDWLTGIGGAERVVYELHKLYPDAPIYTSQYDAAGIDWFADADIRTMWLQRLPKKLKKFLPIFRAWSFSNLDLSEFDLVISSSGSEAKGVKTGPDTVHISYCHSPTHYYWIRKDEYLSQPGFPRGFNWIAKIGLRLLIGPLKRADRRAAKRPDYMIANSEYTRNNIKKFYRRDSTVIYPPVEIERFKVKRNNSQLRHGFVVAGRQTPYKRFDLAIEACNELKVPLVVIGDGPDHKRLTKIAGRSTTFLTNVSDSEMPEHFQTALAFIMPNADDFGIVAVEAMAAGTPVVAYNNGGALDYVLPKSGLFFKRQTVKSLSNALELAAKKNWDYDGIGEHANQFSTDSFRRSMREFIKKVMIERNELT
jgi:glycosyltransferase involved in cell wall biosynthesis